MFELCSIVRGSVELSYLTGGSGPVVVLLHGLAGESGEFAPHDERVDWQGSGEVHDSAVERVGLGKFA